MSRIVVCRFMISEIGKPRDKKDKTPLNCSASVCSLFITTDSITIQQKGLSQKAAPNNECDAIAACVIGGVSFVGGTGNIGGIVLGVFVLRIIFVALNMLGINPNLQYIIKGAIILAACSLDMRKYLVRK